MPKMKTLVFPTRKQMGEQAAADAAACLTELAAGRDEINVLFAAAPSQNEFLRALRETGGVPWRKVNAFQLDEYIGISADAPQRFGNFLMDAIFGHVPLKNCFLIDCENSDYQAEADKYARLLAEYPVDVAFIGIGENGHIAFNDPGVADFNDPFTVKAATLDERCRTQQVNDKCFERLELVPKTALTLTIPAIMAARRIFCVVPGPMKAQAVFETFTAEAGPMHPSTVLRDCGRVNLYLDADSAALIKDLKID